MADLAFPGGTQAGVEHTPWDALPWLQVRLAMVSTIRQGINSREVVRGDTSTG